MTTSHLRSGIEVVAESGDAAVEAFLGAVDVGGGAAEQVGEVGGFELGVVEEEIGHRHEESVVGDEGADLVAEVAAAIGAGRRDAAGDRSLVGDVAPEPRGAVEALLPVEEVARLGTDDAAEEDEQVEAVGVDAVAGQVVRHRLVDEVVRLRRPGEAPDRAPVEAPGVEQEPRREGQPLRLDGGRVGGGRFGGERAGRRRRDHGIGEQPGCAAPLHVERRVGAAERTIGRRAAKHSHARRMRDRKGRRRGDEHPPVTESSGPRAYAPSPFLAIRPGFSRR